MKRCPYCGTENEPNRIECRECATDLLNPDVAVETDEPLEEELETDEGELPESIEVPPPQLIDAQQLEAAFDHRAGFTRPEWTPLFALVEPIPPHDKVPAWTEIALFWMDRIRADLGGDYRLTRSRNFLLVSPLSSPRVKSLLTFAERAWQIIHTTLPGTAAPPGEEPFPLLIFEDIDDYYTYVSDLYADGTHAASGGMFLTAGYGHIAIPFHSVNDTQYAIAHELVHGCVAHLPIPHWLNEGLAMTLERNIVGGRPMVVDYELAERHRAFWTSPEIQRFWAGRTWDVPGDSNELSYSLAEILVSLLSTNRDAFCHFVRTAQYTDAGRSAAMDCLNLELGQVLTNFLGPGTWSPDRKAISQLLKPSAESKPNP